VGIIEPVDDIRAGNPPSNPPLLDRLTREFVAGGFNVREMMRTICTSRVYQESYQTNQWNEDDEINYSHAIARRLPAEVLFDAIHRASGSQSKIPGLPPGLRAAQILDSSVEVPGGFLDLFGKPPRESACECERSATLMLGPVLNLVNGPIVGNALKDPSNELARLVRTQSDNARLVEELFFSILNRPPTREERAKGIQAIVDAEPEYAQLVEEHRHLEAAVTAYEKELPAKQADWEKTVRNSPVWTILEPASASTQKGKSILTKQSDHSLLASGENPFPELYTVTADCKLKVITAVRLEVLPHPSLPARGPGRANNGNFVLNEFTLTAGPKANPQAAKPVALRNAIADFSQNGFAVAGAIDGNFDSGWAVSPQMGQAHVAIFEIATPIDSGQEITLTFHLDQRWPGKDHNLGRFRLSVTASQPPFSLMGPPEAMARILRSEPDQRTGKQKAELAKYYRSLDTELARLNQAVENHYVPADKRLLGAQDLAWALINSEAFLFNY
jgi:hypothetical protein